MNEDFIKSVEVALEELSLLRRPTGINGIVQRLSELFPDRLDFKNSGNELIISKAGSRREFGLRSPAPQLITVIKNGNGNTYTVHRNWRWTPQQNRTVNHIVRMVRSWLYPKKRRKLR
jgi:hypothetical protein